MGTSELEAPQRLALLRKTGFGHSSAGPCLGVGAEGGEVARHCATPKGCETCVNLPRLRLVPQVLFQT